MVALPRIIVKRWPGAGVDVLVNNAGLGRNNAALWDGSTASWVEMISTNVLGVCMATREALKVRLLRASGQGFQRRFAWVFACAELCESLLVGVPATTILPAAQWRAICSS